jgi:hypothetical protein
MAALLDKAKEGQYSMSLSTVDRRVNYANFVAMPGVEQVVKVIGSERPVSVVNRPVGKKTDRTITLSPQ